MQEEATYKILLGRAYISVLRYFGWGAGGSSPPPKKKGKVKEQRHIRGLCVWLWQNWQAHAKCKILLGQGIALPS